MSSTPMTITLYDQETSEVKATFTRMFVPWKLLKAAVRIEKELDPDNMTDEMVDKLAGLVVEAFGNQFSIADLNDGADVTEMVNVLNMIISKAQGGLNPTIPGR